VGGLRFGGGPRELASAAEGAPTRCAVLAFRVSNPLDLPITILGDGVLTVGLCDNGVK
jgi:hypothetical protein